MTDNSKVASPTGIVVTVLMIALSGVGTWFLIPLMWNTWRAGSWPSIEGEVVSNTSSSFEKYVRRRGMVEAWRVDIRYRYVVGDAQYEGDRLKQGSRNEGEGPAVERIAALQPGSPVAVFYNPSSPGESFLVRENSLWVTIGGALVVLMFFLSIMALFEQVGMSLRPSKKKSKKRRPKPRPQAGY